MQEPSQPLPPVLQAEAYRGDSYVLIRNERTENAVVQTRAHVEGPIAEVPDFAAFLDATAGLVAEAQVVVTLGDSRTANFSNWARALARNHLREADAIVINLADWARPAEEHIAVLEFYLDWLSRQGAGPASVVFVGGLTDMHNKAARYTDFMNVSHYLPEDEPAALFSPAEEQAWEHPYGGELARLGEMLPTETDETFRWIARRIVAIMRLLARVCDDRGAAFCAALEPNSYADYSPGYEHALHRSYDEAGEAAGEFENWCAEHRFSRDPSAFHIFDLRGLLEELRRLWQAEADRSSHAAYLDWSGLFREVEACCFDDVHFDAVHYNALGVRLIAEAAFGHLQQSRITAPG